MDELSVHADLVVGYDFHSIYRQIFSAMLYFGGCCAHVDAWLSGSGSVNVACLGSLDFIVSHPPMLPKLSINNFVHF